MMERMSQDQIDKLSKRLAELRLGDTHNLIVALLMDMSVGSFGLHEEIAQEKAVAIMKLITPTGASGTQAHAALASEPVKEQTVDMLKEVTESLNQASQPPVLVEDRCPDCPKYELDSMGTVEKIRCHTCRRSHYRPV